MCRPAPAPSLGCGGEGRPKGHEPCLRPPRGDIDDAHQRRSPGRCVQERHRPNLKDTPLAFAHGFNIRYQPIVPPRRVSMCSWLPQGLGHTVRSTYVAGKGVTLPGYW